MLVAGRIDEDLGHDLTRELGTRQFRLALRVIMRFDSGRSVILKITRPDGRTCEGQGARSMTASDAATSGASRYDAIQLIKRERRRYGLRAQ